MSQLIQQQNFLHQLHTGRDEAALVVLDARRRRQLLHTAGDVLGLSGHHLDSDRALLLSVSGVRGDYAEVHALGHSVSNLVPQCNATDVPTVETIASLHHQNSQNHRPAPRYRRLSYTIFQNIYLLSTTKVMLSSLFSLFVCVFVRTVVDRVG